MASMNLFPGWGPYTICFHSQQPSEQYVTTLNSHLNIIFWQSALITHIKIVKISEPYTICHDHTTFTYFQLFDLKNNQLAATTWNLQNPVQTDMNLNKKNTPIPPVKCPVQYPQSRAMVSPTDEATKLASQDAGIWWQLQWVGVRATTPKKKRLFEGNQILMSNNLFMGMMCAVITHIWEIYCHTDILPFYCSVTSQQPHLCHKTIMFFLSAHTFSTRLFSPLSPCKVQNHLRPRINGLVAAKYPHVLHPNKSSVNEWRSANSEREIYSCLLNWDIVASSLVVLCCSSANQEINHEHQPFKKEQLVWRPNNPPNTLSHCHPQTTHIILRKKDTTYQVPISTLSSLYTSSPLIVIFPPKRRPPAHLPGPRFQSEAFHDWVFSKGSHSYTCHAFSKQCFFHKKGQKQDVQGNWQHPK